MNGQIGFVGKKLKSQNGASLMMALLLFVVCAAIGSIVLTAGTISSGRLADKADMDQRYYRVFSAAEVLKEELNNKKVVVTRTKNNDTYTFNIDSDYEDFLSERTKELFASTNNDEAMWNSDFYYANEIDSGGEKVKIKNDFKLNVNTATSETVDVSSTVSNGEMDLLVSDDNYVIRMIFTPVVSEVVENSGDLITKTATITWVLNSVEKVY